MVPDLSPDLSGALGAALDDALDRVPAARLAPVVDRLIRDYRSGTVPTAPILPPSVERLLSDDDYYKRINLMALRNTRIGNLLGLSSLTLPLPEPGCGLMLFGKPFGEGELCRLGAAAETALAAHTSDHSTIASAAAPP